MYTNKQKESLKKTSSEIKEKESTYMMQNECGSKRIFI